ncbi:MAG TPA: response regulator transcription factor [Methylomirabilota bacterium]|jgi:two-component system KDP operon response regulator KdpE|nr:response regulator transcription factor [Methylomirabilota bacterium]
MGESPATTPGARGSDRAVRVLLVVSDKPLANTIDLTLRHGRYLSRITGTVDDAKVAIAEWKPTLLIVDIDTEAGGGIQLIDEARNHGPMGVIALTRRSDLRGKLDAFERGADDYIGIPFVPDDLVARARAVIRRTNGSAGELVPRLRIGDLEIDVLNRKVLAGEHELHLTSLEQALLYLLAANAGSILTREQILDALWGTDFVIESNVVDRHVRALRAKLQNDWHKPRYIETVPGAGYRFVSASEVKET